jgi:type I restriction enzyme M protein
VRNIKAKVQAIEDAVYDFKAVNPNAKSNEDLRTPVELIAVIENMVARFPIFVQH